MAFGRRDAALPRSLRPRLGIADAARAGALAGLVGAGAMVLAGRVERMVVPQRKGKKAPPSVEGDWKDLISAEAKRRGIRLTARQAAALATASHLIYSVTLGAAYGVSQRALPLPKAARNFMHDGLALAAAAPDRLRPPRKSQETQRAKKGKRTAAGVVAPPLVYALATAAAFKLFTREGRID